MSQNINQRKCPLSTSKKEEVALYTRKGGGFKGRGRGTFIDDDLGHGRGRGQQGRTFTCNICLYRDLVHRVLLMLKSFCSTERASIQCTGSNIANFTAKNKSVPELS